MILETTPLSMAESLDYVNKEEESETDIIGFIKKFSKLKPKDGQDIRKKIQELGLLKVKEDHISKIIDLLPDSQEELNKIFVDVSLDEDEAKKITDIIKEYK